MKNYIEDGKFYDPIKGTFYPLSEYLTSVFAENQKALWLANMITHYRHNHIEWWNKCWGRNGGRYQGNWFGEYEEEKRKVNESSKRQIIRKCRDYMIYHHIGVEVFQLLDNNDPKTLVLAEKLLTEKSETNAV
jgi:hypothetical protein